MVEVTSLAQTVLSISLSLSGRSRKTSVSSYHGVWKVPSSPPLSPVSSHPLPLFSPLSNSFFFSMTLQTLLLAFYPFPFHLLPPLLHHRPQEDSLVALGLVLATLTQGSSISLRVGLASLIPG